jgi:uncharacterized protein YoxC
VLIWPGAILLTLLLYGAELREIIKTREIKVSGLFEIGQSVNKLNENTQTELNGLLKYVEEIRANTTDSAKVKQLSEDLQGKVDSLRSNLNKDIKQIEQIQLAPLAIPSQQTTEPGTVGSARAQAQQWESRGFESIVSKDIAAATDAFAKAENAWPDYHNVAEIRRYLAKMKKELEHAPEGGKGAIWNEIYRTLLTTYSWGMPPAVRTKLREAL